MRLRGSRGADPQNLIRVMPAQGDLGISYRRIPVYQKEDARLNAFRDTRVLTEAALAVALAFVLGFVVLFKMPFGEALDMVSDGAITDAATVLGLLMRAGAATGGGLH